MKLEHFGMPEPGDCRVVFSASAEELEAAVQAEQAAPDAPKEEEDLLTAAVNRAILEGFSPLFAQLMEEHRLVPVTDPDFELLAVNRAEGFRAGAEFFCLPPLELGRYTGFVQPIRPRPIRKLTLELEINRHHGDEDRAADEAGKNALRDKKTYDTWQEGFAQIFEAVLENKPFIMNVYHSVRREKIESFLYKLTYQLIADVVEEKCSRDHLPETDKQFIADFYKYGFVGIMLDWIDRGMKEDYQKIVDLLAVTLHGNIANSIRNFEQVKEKM